MFKKMLIFAALVAPVLVVLAVAQQPPIKRIPLQTVDFLPGFTTVTLAAEVAADDCVAGNTNPGIETTYVLEGAILVEVRGRSPETLKAVVSFQIPPLGGGLLQKGGPRQLGVPAGCTCVGWKGVERLIA